MSNLRAAAIAACFLVCLVAVAVHADDLTSPDAVAAFSAAKYDAINSVKVLCTSTSHGTMGGLAQSFQATAQIEFLRPDSLRVDGTDMFGHTYGIASGSGQTMLLSMGQWKKSSSAEMAIASVTGTAEGAATTVPALLLHTKWRYPFGPLGYTKNVGSDVIDGRKSYRIAKAIGSIVQIFWIDKKSGLVVKEQSIIGLSGMQMNTIRTYSYQGVNGPIDPSVFVMPA